MKRRIKISCTLLILIFSLILSLNLSAEVVTTFTIGNGGSLLWNGWSGASCDCFNNGDNCIITVTKTTESVTPVQGGGWTLHGDLDELEAEITPPVGGGFTQNLSISNYPFLDNSTVKILVCDDYPILVGRVIDLSGITTDVNGLFEVFIPEE